MTSGGWLKGGPNGAPIKFTPCDACVRLHDACVEAIAIRIRQANPEWSWVRAEARAKIEYGKGVRE